MRQVEAVADSAAERLRSLQILKGETRDRSPRATEGRLAWGVGGCLAGAAAAAAAAWIAPTVRAPAAPAALVVDPNGPTRPAPADAGAAVLVASGYVSPRQGATVASEVTGRVVRLLVREGQRVEVGQVLAELDDQSARAQLATNLAQADAGRAQLALKRAALTEAERDLERAETLAARGFIAASVLLTKRSLLEQAQDEVAAAAKTVAAYDASAQGARSVLGKYVVTAPFSGVVVGINAQVGEIISPISAGGGFTRTGICTIINMDHLDVAVDVGESLISRVRLGQPAQVVLDAYPELRVPARVSAIVPTADSEKGSIRVRVELLKADPRIFPHMTAKVSFLRNGDDQTSPGAL